MKNLNKKGDVELIWEARDEGEGVIGCFQFTHDAIDKLERVARHLNSMVAFAEVDLVAFARIDLVKIGAQATFSFSNTSALLASEGSLEAAHADAAACLNETSDGDNHGFTLASVDLYRDVNGEWRISPVAIYKDGAESSGYDVSLDFLKKEARRYFSHFVSIYSCIEGEHVTHDHKALELPLDKIDEVRLLENTIDPYVGFNGCLFETYGEQAELVQQAFNEDPSRVFKYEESDGQLTITRGIGGDCIGYLIAERPTYGHIRFVDAVDQPSLV
ncbi:hypothetical protein [uncultured Umboniibacter sp.]|uniref:hypothetical protein n=1 Tax=uncultured Umboniibacter sp. TaxID=1798917 RepID=UPI00262A17B0|nr:hypothetical protein [uncultured Umboniibacter sp.]